MSKFLILLVGSVMCVEYLFELQQTCLQTSTHGCSSWNTTGKFGLNTTGCFPQSTYIMTKEGIKGMEQLRVGDEILAYDKQTRQNIYSPVVAWLHRDVEARFEYEEIQHKSSKIYASAKHNIAFISNDSIEYVYSQLATHREMYSSSGDGYLVDHQTTRILRGIYAPYTAAGNFYISSFDNPMDLVLVHCFAHIKNPQKYQTVFYWSMRVCQFLGLNQQPEGPYRHPLSLLFQSMFPHLVDYGDHYRQYEQVNMDEPHVESSASTSSNNQRRQKLRTLMFSTASLISNPLIMN